MIEMSLKDGVFKISVNEDELRPRHESQLIYWGLEHNASDDTYCSTESDAMTIGPKVVQYFTKSDLKYTLDSHLSEVLAAQEQARTELARAQDVCRALKDGQIDRTQLAEFTKFLDREIPRLLKDHQIKAALHLLNVGNGANFSVPGSGKTSVVLSVFARLRQLEVVDALFVVGPPACFFPWRNEYRAVLGVDPSCEMLAGGNVDDRKSRYLVGPDSAVDLYLTTFQTLQRDQQQVVRLFAHSGVRFYLVIDEAHYIKQLDGTWANAVLSVAPHAERRCILTGTPFPKSLIDAFNLFDVLWPSLSPLASEDRHRIELCAQRNDQAAAAALLDERIGPLFYRVRKQDLGLADQVFHDPIRVEMNLHEKHVYDSILDRITFESHHDFYRDFELRTRLRRGRMIRLRQCTSYAALLKSALTDYDEDLLDKDPSLADVIQHYDQLEEPGKLGALVALVKRLRTEGEKVVIWSNFVGTLKLIVARLRSAGHGVRLIYGGTPFENATVEEELSRESIVRDFVEPNSGVDILVANPAACAESISLHRACSHAIYYDLSYNCAQYLQSLDRIHRVGGSEDKPAHYHILEYKDSVDHDILLNVRQKAHTMSHIIDREYAVYSLDMFNDSEELDAYDRLFGNKP